VDEQHELSERLQGIADHLTVRTATLLAQNVRARLTPEVMDELRHWIGVAVRGAALEGARNAADTKAALLPVAKAGRADAQQMAITRHNGTRKLPDGI
jgi:hypothetical protein